MVAKWPLEVEIAMGILPVPISVSSGHFALRYEVPKFLARGGHLCMAVLTIAVVCIHWRHFDLVVGTASARIFGLSTNSTKGLASYRYYHGKLRKIGMETF